MSRPDGRDGATPRGPFPGRSIRWADIKTFRQHFSRGGAGAASEFQNGSPRRQQRENRRQPRMCRYLAPGIGLRVAAIELEGFLVHGVRSWPASQADVCSVLIMVPRAAVRRVSEIERTQQRPEMLLVDPPATDRALIDRLADLRRAGGTNRRSVSMEFRQRGSHSRPQWARIRRAWPSRSATTSS